KGGEEEEGETPAEQGQASSDEASEEARVGDDAPPATAEPAEVDPGASEVREPSTPETPTMASTTEDRDTKSSTPSAAAPSDKADASDQKDAADASEKSSPSALSPAPAAVQSLEPQGLGGWLWKHIYAVLAVGLGLVVALMAWMFWLASRRQANQASAITPEMVQEKLDQINLDLNPPTGGNGPRSSLMPYQDNPVSWLRTQ